MEQILHQLRLAVYLNIHMALYVPGGIPCWEPSPSQDMSEVKDSDGKPEQPMAKGQVRRDPP